MTAALTLKGDLKTFERMIARVQSLATGRMSREYAPRVAAEQLRTLAAAGKAGQTNPQGRAWKKTKSGAPLKWPGQAQLTVRVENGRVVAKLSGPRYLAAQHAGWRRFSNRDGALRRWKSPPRRILPKGALPKRWAEPILKALNIGWREFMQTTTVARARK